MTASVAKICPGTSMPGREVGAAGSVSRVITAMITAARKLGAKIQPQAATSRMSPPTIAPKASPPVVPAPHNAI